MSAPLAIGIGCRRNCSAEAIMALVREAQNRVGQGRPAKLFTLAEKAEEPGLRAAAHALGLDLAGLSRESLQAAMTDIETPSARAEAALGLASVSEAAALAGAGKGSRLVLARIAAGGATCAVAAPAEEC